MSGSREELLSPVDLLDEAAADISSEQNNEAQDLFSVILAGENDFCPLAVALEETASDEITEHDMSVTCLYQAVVCILVRQKALPSS